MWQIPAIPFQLLNFLAIPIFSSSEIQRIDVTTNQSQFFSFFSSAITLQISTKHYWFRYHEGRRVQRVRSGQSEQVRHSCIVCATLATYCHCLGEMGFTHFTSPKKNLSHIHERRAPSSSSQICRLRWSTGRWFRRIGRISINIVNFSPQSQSGPPPHISKTFPTAAMRPTTLRCSSSDKACAACALPEALPPRGRVWFFSRFRRGFIFSSTTMSMRLVLMFKLSFK